ncbi:MAG: epoxyqueuosine reductase [Promethearchaeota archaeon]
MIDSKTIKKFVFQLGANLCGIAPIERFKAAPSGFHPKDVYNDCKSVIVFASFFPLSTLQATTNSPYTMVRNLMVNHIDEISFRVAKYLESKGIPAIPIPSAEPYDYWDEEKTHGRGIISLKHAGVLAGLGEMGKNTLLINNEFGNMIWLGAVLTSLELNGDLMTNYQACIPDCSICIDKCPQNALDGITIDQKQCRQISTSFTTGGGWVLSCNICRKICPNHAGIKKPK